MSVNKAILLGNVTADFEKKTTESWKSVWSVWIALNESWVDKHGVKQEKVEFVNLVVWWKLADTFETYVKKWQKIYVEWKIVTRNWETNEGEKKYRTEVLVNRFEFAGWSKQENQTSQRSSQDDEINVEDLPF